MSEKGILFSGPMVRAILDGRKNQTRRICKSGMVNENPLAKGYFTDQTGKLVIPKYRIGDVLYVRETWTEWDGGFIYRADSIYSGKWHSSMFMPKAAARIWLKVTDVRVERLQEITDDGARHEGVENREAFRELWGKINGESSWDNNPYVWVIKFERVEK